MNDEVWRARGLTDQIWYNYDEAGKEISGFEEETGKRVDVGLFDVTGIRPTHVAGQGAWVYWLEVTYKDGSTRLFNPQYLRYIEYKE